MEGCSSHTLWISSAFLREMIRQNGYRERFIDKTTRQPEEQNRKTVVEMKALYISLSEKEDISVNLIYCGLPEALYKMFYAAKLQISFASKMLVHSGPEDSVPDFMASFCVCLFTCSCGAAYISRTTGDLPERVHEHHRVWLKVGAIKTTISAACSHLVDPSHSECN